MSFAFVDLFAGIGGFHLALQQLGGKAVLASEIDPDARRIYQHNLAHHMDGEVLGDIVPLTEGVVDNVIPAHDVLAAGFPCQPFSKSGFQRGVNETRGTLFHNIARVLEARRPRVVILENVRNLVGPNHRHTWHLIRKTLRDLGYRTPDQPTVFSPHLMPKELLGAPQVRERVFIVAVYVGRRSWEFTEDPLLAPNRPVTTWRPRDWDLEKAILQRDDEVEHLSSFRLSDSEIDLIALWEDFLQSLGEAQGNRLPGHPLWADYFVSNPDMGEWPDWKVDFVSKNSAYYRSHRKGINSWRKRHDNLNGIPDSRRKLEWQAQDMESIWDGLIQLRPSGLRVKKANYVPALVAMNQTSIFGPRKRRLTVREGARLQGFPDAYSFVDQLDTKSFKQLGNAVSVGTVTQVLSQAVYLWDFFPKDIGNEIRKARVDLGLPDAPLQFEANEGGQ